MLEQILWTACITPFNHDASKIDYKSLEKCLHAQDKSGNGILLFGSTGEGLSLSDSEKKEILNFTINLNLKSQIMVGFPSHNLISALEWLEFCNTKAIDGYLMTTTIYTKPGIFGQTNWFEALLNKSSHPAMLYNIPGRAAVKLYPEVVKNLQHHDKFLAIKDSSGVIESIVDYKISAPNIAVYCGDDYMMPSMAIEGSGGLISIASNSWPNSTRRYVETSLRGEKIKSKLFWQAHRALFTASNPIAIKALMKDIGMIEHDTVRLPLSMKDLPSRQTLLNYHQAILNWRSENV